MDWFSVEDRPKFSLFRLFDQLQIPDLLLDLTFPSGLSPSLLRLISRQMSTSLVDHQLRSRTSNRLSEDQAVN